MAVKSESILYLDSSHGQHCSQHHAEAQGRMTLGI
jgi:hypothetical protein